MSLDSNFIVLSIDLDKSGLVWCPEIGDEISVREDPELVSILVDPKGMSPSQLRKQFIWLPTVEQLVMQFEARQALLFHAGLNSALSYEAVIKTTVGMIEAQAATLRLAFGKVLHALLTGQAEDSALH